MIKDIIENNENIDLNKSKIEMLKKVIPNCFDKNGKLDLELLKKDLSDSVEFSKESFELNFLGKSYAKMISGLDTETVIEPNLENNTKEENKDSENIFISGDNLDVLKHLLKAYEGKIKCIYIDPPYNTGSDGFVYKDAFKFTTKNLVEKIDIGEEEAERILNMTSVNSSSHSAWLTFMYPRIYIARQLLKNDGVLFISIDENEAQHLLMQCSEIFGEENVDSLIWQKTDSQVDRNTNSKIINRFKSEHESIVVCYKSKEITTFNKIMRLPDWKNEQKNADNDPRGPWMSGIISYEEGHKNEDKNSEYYYELTTPSGKCMTRHWFYTKEEMNNLIEDNRISFPKNGDGVPRLKTFQNEEKEYYMGSILRGFGTSSSAKDEIESIFGNREVFDTPKPTKLIKELVRAVTNDNDIVIDFFAGSASTAEAVISLNSETKKKLKYIMIQLPEKCNVKSQAIKEGFKTIDEIGQERIRRVAKKIKEKTNANIDYGFRHYRLKETPENLLNKLELFNSELINDNYELYKEYGIETILETWKLKDGYEFTTNIENIDCNEYNVYKCGEYLYFINPNITINNIQALLDKYNKEENFVCDKLILFGYSFKFNEIEMIKNNIKQVKNFKNIDVKVYTRY